MKAVRILSNWSRFSVPTVKWGTVSCTVAPLFRWRRLAAKCLHRWANEACDALGIRRELVGGELLLQSGQRVFVANHQSLLDVIVIASFLPSDHRWVAKKELFMAPLVGWHLLLNGHVPVVRNKRKGTNVGLQERLHRVVAEGADPVFFPEGTRSRDGQLGDFRIGAFRTAVEEGLPVQPLVVRGSGELMKKGALALEIDRARSCSVTVLPPIPLPTEGDASERAALLRDRVRAAFVAELAS